MEQQKEFDCTQVLADLIDNATASGLFKTAADAMVALQSLGALNRRITELQQENDQLKASATKAD